MEVVAVTGVVDVEDVIEVVSEVVLEVVSVLDDVVLDDVVLDDVVLEDVELEMLDYVVLEVKEPVDAALEVVLNEVLVLMEDEIVEVCVIC